MRASIAYDATMGSTVFSVRAVPVFTNDGAIREWAGIHTDITRRKLTEQPLRDGERQFRELTDAMPQIVWGARPDGHFDYYPRRWYDFLTKSAYRPVR